MAKFVQEDVDIYDTIIDQTKRLSDLDDDLGDKMSKLLGITDDLAALNEDILDLDNKRLNVGKDQARVISAALKQLSPIRDRVANIAKGFANVKAQAAAFNAILAGNPVLGIATALIAVLTLIKKINKELGETRTNLGVSALEAAKIRARIVLIGEGLKFVGLEAKDAEESFQAIRKTFGGIDSATSTFVANLAKAQLNTGATSAQLANLLAIQESVTSSSREALLAQLKTVSAAIRLEGVAPDAVFAELAENAEAVALNIRDGGDSLIKAAVQARKLGVEFRTVTGIADKLLDFENSIESQLKASVLLGREINLDRARQLALNNDLAGALEEVVTQVGGEAEFNELNRVQRQALADSVGVSVSELSRLVRDNANAGIEGVASSFTDVEKYQNESISLLNQVVRNTSRSASSNAKTAEQTQ